MALNQASKIRVGVLRGGPSSEYDISLKTGQNVLKNLSEKYIGHDILISRDGDWHFGGVTRSPDKVLKNVDVIFNALHGTYGEDGKIQSILEQFGTPYTGSRSLPSSFAMNKALTKKILRAHGIKTPVSYVLNPRDYTNTNILDIWKSFPQPSVVKPVSGGSSIGVYIVYSFPEFVNALEMSFRQGGPVLVEEYIQGDEATVSVVEAGERGSVYSLLPVEILKGSTNYFDFSAKYSHLDQKKCPSSFTTKIKKTLQDIATKAHGALGLRHYSNSDFIIHPKRGIYLIEVNTLPGLTDNSILPLSLKHSNIEIGEFIDHTINLALNSRN